MTFYSLCLMKIGLMTNPLFRKKERSLIDTLLHEDVDICAPTIDYFVSLFL